MRDHISLAAGFCVVIVVALALARWGRARALVVLSMGALAGSTSSLALGGRSALSDFALGGLLGLPVLIGAVLSHDRAQRRRVPTMVAGKH